ncbi:hypothetical protein HOY80DRAFT_248816 [Tuber brumale]|nr:hypothetical protein HOY80DRAFT_248816 [Tuber brumale]
MLCGSTLGSCARRLPCDRICAGCKHAVLSGTTIPVLALVGRLGPTSCCLITQIQQRFSRLPRTITSGPAMPFLDAPNEIILHISEESRLNLSNLTSLVRASHGPSALLQNALTEACSAFDPGSPAGHCRVTLLIAKTISQSKSSLVEAYWTLYHSEITALLRDHHTKPHNARPPIFQGWCVDVYIALLQQDLEDQDMTASSGHLQPGDTVTARPVPRTVSIVQEGVLKKFLLHPPAALGLE